MRCRTIDGSSVRCQPYAVGIVGTHDMRSNEHRNIICTKTIDDTMI